MFLELFYTLLPIKLLQQKKIIHPNSITSFTNLIEWKTEPIFC